MIIQKYKDKKEWEDARMGVITGTKLKTIISRRDKKPIKGYYGLIAERIAVPPSEENRMDRGTRLEDDGIVRFMKETGKKVNIDLVLICRDDNKSICYSPDGYIGKTETVEVKCLNSPSHVEAWVTQKVPTEYEEQVMQPFIVNDKLRKLYLVFYDPRMPKDFFYLTVNRKDVKEKVDEYLELERKVLAEIDDIEKQLTF